MRLTYRMLPFAAGFAILQAIFALNLSAQIQGPWDNLIIRGAIMIDGTGAPPKGPVDIFVNRGVIQRVQAFDPISLNSSGGKSNDPAGAHVIDASGMYVMPGLIDMHMHFSADVPLDYQYKLLLGHGVTTTRVFNIGNMGSADQMMAEKKRIDSNESTVIAPRLYIYPFWPGGDPRASNASQAAAIVREWKAKGVDGVKMAGLPGEYPDVLQVVGDEVRANNMGLAVHIAQEAVFPMNAVRVAQAGASTIEHHYGYSEASFSDQRIQKLPVDYNFAKEEERFYETGAVWLQADLKKLHTTVIDDLLATQKKTGFTMIPTMVVYEANRDLERAKALPWHDKFTMPAMMAHWSPSPSSHGSYFYHWTSINEGDWSQMYHRWMDFVQDFKNRGGNVAVGSDVGSIYALWGFATIREMELLEEAGFNPLEAIHAATEVGAISLGNHKLGAIRPGYTADFVVVNANPMEDLKVMYGSGATRQGADGSAVQVKAVKYTIKDGVVYDSQALLKDVQDMVAKAKAAKK